MASPRWLPLESNPQVMNKLLGEIGVPNTWSFVDVFGLDEDLLAIVPQPLGALVLLFSICEKEEKFRLEQEQAIEASGSTVSPNVYFMKQYVGNACGTVALIHTVANNLNKMQLNDGPLKDFVEMTKDKDPEARGHALENFVGISNAHDKLAQEGQTETPDRDVKLEPHFISLVNVDGNIYELDGRKKFAINHGKTSESSFLNDAAAVCRQFMERNPEETRFAIMAFAPTQ